MCDRSPHPFDEDQVDKFPFDEKEDQQHCAASEKNRRTIGILQNKNSIDIETQNSNMRKRQQKPYHHQQGHQQDEQYSPYVFFHTEESIKAVACMEKKSAATFKTSSASYIYPESASVAMEPRCSQSPSSNPVSFLPTPAQRHQAESAALSGVRPPRKQIAVGSDVPRVPQQPVKDTAEAPAQEHVSSAIPPMANLLRELSPSWNQYFDPLPKDDDDDNDRRVLPKPQSSKPGGTNTNGGTEFEEYDSFVPPRSNPSTQPQSSLSSYGLLEILPELTPVWNRYLDFSQLSSSCPGSKQPHHREHPWCVDDACAATEAAPETKSPAKSQRQDEESNMGILPAGGPPKVITLQPDLPKTITVTPNSRAPAQGFAHPPQMVTTQATTLTTSTTMTTTLTTTALTQTMAPTANYNGVGPMASWTSPQHATKSQPPVWSCPYASTPSPLYVLPTSRPTRPISATATTPTCSNDHRRQRRRSSPEPQRLDWSSRLNMPLSDAVAAAAAAAASTQKTSTSDTITNSTALVRHRPAVPSPSLDMPATPVPNALSPSASSAVQVIGPPHLCIYKVSLPSHLVDLLDPLVQKAEVHAKSLPRGWRTNLFSLTKQDLPAYDIPGAFDEISTLTRAVSEQIRLLYRPQAEVYMDPRQQPHILKYAVDDDFCGVELHHDQCDVTANLMLSSSNDYSGGGTYLDVVQMTIHLERGEFLLHPGSLAHAGRDISSGSRYLMVFFCHLR